jgi:hypothetical protein
MSHGHDMRRVYEPRPLPAVVLLSASRRGSSAAGSSHAASLGGRLRVRDQPLRWPQISRHELAKTSTDRLGFAGCWFFSRWAHGLKARGCQNSLGIILWWLKIKVGAYKMPVTINCYAL